MRTTTIGLFNSRDDAERAIMALRNRGVDENDISFVYTNREETMETREGDTVSATSTGAATGAATGGVVGALAGLAVANGILPGLGSLFVAGPLATALGFTGAAATTVGGAVTGAAAGGIIGALAGLGVDESDAELYENRIREGELLVAINDGGPGVRDELRRNGAEEIREYSMA